MPIREFKQIISKHSLKFEYGLILIIFIFHFWLCSYGTWNIFYSVTNQDKVFDSLGEHILDGSCEVNRAYIGTEAFIVKGKSYAYFGPFPALIRIFLNFINPNKYGEWMNLSGLIATCFTIVGFYKILKHQLSLNEKINPLDKEIILLLSIFFLGIGSPISHLTSDLWVYQESILWGFCFSIWSIYFILIYFYKKDFQEKSLFILSFTSGFALLSRASFGIPLILATIFLFINYVVSYKSSKRINFRNYILLIPLIMALSFQGYYNYKRFGSITNFADYNSYRLFQLKKEQNEHFKKFGAINISRIPFNLTSYFKIEKKYFQNKPPYVFIRGGAISPNVITLDYGKIPLTVIVPWLLFSGFLGLMVLFKKKINTLPVIVFLILLTQCLMILSFLTIHYRYTIDFLPILVYLLAILLSDLDKLKSVRATHFIIIFLFLGIVGSISCLFNTFNNIKSTTQNPEQKEIINEIFTYTESFINKLNYFF